MSAIRLDRDAPEPVRPLRGRHDGVAMCARFLICTWETKRSPIAPPTPICTLVGAGLRSHRFVTAGCANPLQAIAGPRGTFPVALSSESNPLIGRRRIGPFHFGGCNAQGERRCAGPLVAPDGLRQPLCAILSRGLLPLSCLSSLTQVSG